MGWGSYPQSQTGVILGRGGRQGTFAGELPDRPPSPASGHVPRGPQEAGERHVASRSRRTVTGKPYRPVWSKENGGGAGGVSVLTDNVRDANVGARPPGASRPALLPGWGLWVSHWRRKTLRGHKDFQTGGRRRKPSECRPLRSGSGTAGRPGDGAGGCAGAAGPQPRCGGSQGFRVSVKGRPGRAWGWPGSL